MRNPIAQIVAALDVAKSIRLQKISYDGAVVDFITSEASGIPRLSKPDEQETVDEWFSRHGIGESERNTPG